MPTMHRTYRRTYGRDTTEQPPPPWLVAKADRAEPMLRADRETTVYYAGEHDTGTFAKSPCHTFWGVQFSPAATCPECGRVFNLADATDAAEFHAGHDCEAAPVLPAAVTSAAERRVTITPAEVDRLPGLLGRLLRANLERRGYYAVTQDGVRTLYTMEAGR